MKTNNIQIIKLEPEDGNYLTQNTLKEGEERLFCSVVYLGKNDSEANWTEWTEEQKKTYEEEKEAADKVEEVASDETK